jgi:hypothetical protein
MASRVRLEDLLGRLGKGGSGWRFETALKGSLGFGESGLLRSDDWGSGALRLGRTLDKMEPVRGGSDGGGSNLWFSNPPKAGKVGGVEVSPPRCGKVCPSEGEVSGAAGEDRVAFSSEDVGAEEEGRRGGRPVSKLGELAGEGGAP